MADHPLPPRACYFAAECAALLGMSVGTFYRQYGALLSRGMPLSKTLGRVRIPKETFDAWRRSGKAPPPPANDEAPIGAKSDDQHRRDLAKEYAR